MKKIRLTDFDSGEMIALNVEAKSEIVAVRNLAATKKYAKRTSIMLTKGRGLLVEESAEIVCYQLGI